MSGLYNVVFGDGKELDRLSLLGTALLNIGEEDVERFRDCWPERHGDALVLAIYTRMGGGNREAYAECIKHLQEHPNYLSDADDTFDSTYATFRFSYPTEAPEIVLMVDDMDKDEFWSLAMKAIGELAQPIRNMDEEWQEAIAKMEAGDPETVARAAPMVENIVNQLKEGKPIIVIGNEIQGVGVDAQADPHD